MSRDAPSLITLPSVAVIFSDDLLACKRIISTYVEKVIVYEDHIDVILKIVDLTGKLGEYRCLCFVTCFALFAL